MSRNARDKGRHIAPQLPFSAHLLSEYFPSRKNINFMILKISKPTPSRPKALNSQTKLERQYHGKKVKDSYSRCFANFCTYCPPKMGSGNSGKNGLPTGL